MAPEKKVAIGFSGVEELSSSKVNIKRLLWVFAVTKFKDIIQASSDALLDIVFSAIFVYGKQVQNW